jgi:septation ring formation regulator EzrA
MYNIYNKETGELLEKQITEQKLIAFANERFAETDNIEDAIENDLLFYDNAYDAQESLEAFGFTVEEV